MEKITPKLLNWASILEQGTRDQAVTTASMPFIHPHLALMPDAHLGLGATVGSVIPTLGAIIPAAVGVDIGCGMIAVRTRFTSDELPADRRPLREAIERAVPLSAGAANSRISRDLCEKWWIDLPDKDLAYLAEGTDEFWAYIREMRWAQRYALLNREEMMDRVVRQFAEWVGLGSADDVERVEEINCHHNYTEQERHFGRDVWLSRKGAINAERGRAGLIPGSMGTASYVVSGLGNALVLNSAPHGAGREYSRSKARRTFTREQLREAMAGIEYRDTDAFIDEIPAAYKDIDRVMADAAELVEVRHTLRQIVNVKGD